MALPESSLMVPEIVSDEVLASSTKARVEGVLDDAPTVICFSGTGGRPGLNTPQRYTPSMVLSVNAPEVLVCPPVPKPEAELVVPEATGRQNIPAPETPVPAESTTVPVIVLPAVVREKASPDTVALVTLAATTCT